LAISQIAGRSFEAATRISALSCVQVPSTAFVWFSSLLFWLAACGLFFSLIWGGAGFFHFVFVFPVSLSGRERDRGQGGASFCPTIAEL
jgi:Na+/alanine symporter